MISFFFFKFEALWLILTMCYSLTKNFILNLEIVSRFIFNIRNSKLINENLLKPRSKLYGTSARAYNFFLLYFWIFVPLMTPSQSNKLFFYLSNVFFCCCCCCCCCWRKLKCYFYMRECSNLSLTLKQTEEKIQRKWLKNLRCVIMYLLIEVEAR